MASLQLGVVSLINESWVVFGSSLKLRIGFRNKRFRRVSERWRFRVQQMSGKEQMSTQELARFAKRNESLRYNVSELVSLMSRQELARFAKRSESLRRILKQYGVSVEKPEENKTSSRLDDLNCEEKHDVVPSSVIDDSKMNTTELPDLRRQEIYSELLAPQRIFQGKTNTIFNISKRTRWRTALSDWNEPLASDEHDSSSPEYRVGSTNQEATDEVNEAYSRVELEYKRFLLECGLSES